VTSATAPGRAPATAGLGPMIVDRPEGRNAVVKLFVFVPFLALVAAVPFAWGWGLSWVDVGLATSFYFFTCAGATVGFHRYFTHRAFKATRPVRVALAAVGSMARRPSAVRALTAASGRAPP
jgi:stearoyl-CoA desaturase (Delta-9 desaturase)